MPLQKLTQLGGTVVCQLKPTDPMPADFRSNTFHSLVSPHMQVTKLEPKPWGESLQYLRPLISFRCLPKAVHQGDSGASYLTKPLQKAAILCRFRFFKSSKTLRCAIWARKRPGGGKPSQNLAECCKWSYFLCQVRSSLHFSIQKNGGREMISPVSQVTFQSQKRKRGFTSFSFPQKPTKVSFTTTKA